MTVFKDPSIPEQKAWTHKHRVRNAVLEAMCEALGVLRARPSGWLKGRHIQENCLKGEIRSSCRQTAALRVWTAGDGGPEG